MEEAERLVLPLEQIDSKNAAAYAAMETALEKALSSATPLTPRNTPQVKAL